MMRQKYRKGSFRDAQNIQAPLLEHHLSPVPQNSSFTLDQDKENKLGLKRSSSIHLLLKSRKSHDRLDVSVSEKVIIT